MKKYLKNSLLGLTLASALFVGFNYVYAAPFDWYVDMRSDDDTFDLTQNLTPPTEDSRDRVLCMHGGYSKAAKWCDAGTGVIIQDGYISLANISPAQIPIVNEFIGTSLEKFSAHDLSILALNEATTTLKAQINSMNSLLIGNQADWTQSSTTLPSFIKNKPTIPTLVQGDWSQSATTSPAYIKNKPEVWNNGAKIATTTTSKLITFSGTTTSGTSTFYLTNDGTSGGAALCSVTPDHVNVIVNDPSNTFGVGYAVTNSNKTLTITVNARSFSATTILGIGVLGSSSLTAAENGTAVSVLVACH